MKQINTRARVLLSFAGLIFAVALFSTVSVHIWGGKPEVAPVRQELTLSDTMTIGDFKNVNDIHPEVIQKVFNVTTKEGLNVLLSQTGLPLAEIADKVHKSGALATENESKDWMKIAAKFLLWIVFLVMAFSLLKNRQINAKTRKLLLFFAVAIFGVALGADPSPMGTVKDAVVLLGSHGVLFPPRLIAFAIMLIGGVMIANKFVCAWGCQFGTLQDLIFRLNRDPQDRRGIIKQYKVPFRITNGVRIFTFALLSFVAFAWGTDIMESVDPFKIFKPAMMGTAGIIFVVTLLVASLFVYRPWCHFFCPFGLVGWLVERFSYFRIHVNRDTCISCEACTKACPSTVMGAILHEDKVIPDCFACGTCIGVCPTNSISFTHEKKIKITNEKEEVELNVEGEAVE